MQYQQQLDLSNRYTRTAMSLHWFMAVLLLGLFAVGIYMHELPLSPWKLQVYSWHKWAGVTAFILVLARLAWRFTHRPPPLPINMSRSAELAAHAGHALLYVLMIAIPLTGWLMSSAKGFQTVYFGIIPIPDLLAKNKELGNLLREVHEVLNFILAAVVIGHIAAAIKHHLINKDDVLTRMLPRSRS
ncbi:cytochrome b [Methylotenera sp. G11]|uniref:cytochrome b n=1 Tax=Methylotenera sp. G11 TaxID=1506585 RepID=UPI0006918E8A|nr:cytochrome b [Methylotenera sp. G11]